MKNPDEQIAESVIEKLKETKKWNTKLIIKLSTWLSDGKATTNDLIFLLENQRPNSSEVIK